MTHLAGKAGNVNITAGDVAGVRAWTVDWTVDMLDTTDFIDGAATNAARTFLPGLSTWSGTFDVVKDSAPTALGTNLTPVAIELEEDNTSIKWTGNVFITGIHASVSAEGLVIYTYDFQGTGDLAEAAS